MTASSMPPHPSGTADRRARLARVAVAVLFVVNGLTFASVVPWLPAIKDELVLGNAALGLGWAAGPLGGLAVGITAGPLAARVGSGRTATRGALLGLLALPAIALAPTWPAFAISMFVLGAADSVTDAAMNAHGLRVQRQYGRSIINSFHAQWSIGAVAGGLLGAGAVALGVPRLVHLSGMAAVLAAAVVLAARWQLHGPGRSERPSAAESRPAVLSDAVDTSRGVRQAVRTAPWLLLGFAALPMLGGVVEDSAASWAAVYLRATLDAATFVAGLGFVAAQTMMVVGRVSGDRLVDRFGAALVARSGSLLAAVGMLAVVTGPAPAVVIAGFGLAGLGVATLFPLGMAAAGAIPGVRTADGVAVASWLARLGFLLAPPVVGLVADEVSLRWGLALVLACAVVAAALSGRLPAHPAGR